MFVSVGVCVGDGRFEVCTILVKECSSWCILVVHFSVIVHSVIVQRSVNVHTNAHSRSAFIIKFVINAQLCILCTFMVLCSF